jgi:hypothetical protein
MLCNFHFACSASCSGHQHCRFGTAGWAILAVIIQLHAQRLERQHQLLDLRCSATSGTASSGTTVTFTVNANANGLAANTYNATITFTNSGTGGTQTRTASLIAASGPQGGPFSPSSFSYTLSPSSGSANYSITNVPSWLTASSTSSNSHFGWEHCVDGGATD